MLNPEDKKKLVSGNEETLKNVYLENYPPVLQFVAENNGSFDEAKEVYSEAFAYFLQLLKTRDFALKCSVQTILYSLGRKIWMEKLKSKHKDFNFIKHKREFIEIEEAFARVKDINKRSELVGEKLAILGEPCRTLVVEVAGHGRKIEEIAERIGFSTSERAWAQMTKCFKKLYRESNSEEISASDDDLLKLSKYLLGDLSAEEEATLELEIRNRNELKQIMLVLEGFLAQVKTHIGGKNIKNQLAGLHRELLTDNFEAAEIISGNQPTMQTRNIILLVILIAVIISGITTFSVVKFFESTAPQATETVAENAENRTPNIAPAEEVARATAEADSNPTEVGATAFAITHDGYFVTTNSGLSAARSIKLVQEGNDIEYRVSVAASNEDLNLAILRIDQEVFKNLPYLPFRIAGDEAALGQEVFSIGFPQNLLTFVEGSLNAVNANIDDKSNYRVSFQINPGSPGSPLISSTGNIIGMISGPNAAVEENSNVLKSGEILSFINNVESETRIRLSNSRYLYGKNRTTQIEIVKPYVFKVKMYY